MAVEVSCEATRSRLTDWEYFVPPTAQLENPAFTKLLAHVTVFLDENSQKSTRGKLGKEWVRGWSDTGLPSSGNQQ